VLNYYYSVSGMYVVGGGSINISASYRNWNMSTNLVKLPNTKFHENLLSGSRAVACIQIYGQAKRQGEFNASTY
jgi:hypothetical protein